MARGPEITDEIKVLIYKVHEEHPKWTNQEIRNWVLAAVHKDKPSLPKEWPSKYVIDRIMPKIREQVKQSKLSPNPIDRPWSTTTMAQYPIPPEALPTVLYVWAWARVNEGIKLTIRDVQWLARLYAVEMPVNVLCTHCRTYARTEMIYEQTGGTFKPWPGIDAYLFGYATKQKITPGKLREILGKDELEQKFEFALPNWDSLWSTTILAPRKGAQKERKKRKGGKK